MSFWIRLAIVSIWVTACFVECAAQDGKLVAGAAQVDITPQELPVNLPGGFNANQGTIIHDRFYSRAIVLGADKLSLAMVLVDNLGAGPEELNEAKEIAAAKTGIPVERMLVSSTHTHSGPSAGVRLGSSAETAYRSLFIRGVAESIIEAHGRLQAASLAFGKHPLASEVFNRRWYLKPGKMPTNPFGDLDQVKMNPPRRADVLDRPAGPTDPDISVISIRDHKNHPLALYANYSLHYVGGVPRGELSSDYFGVFSELMHTRLRAKPGFVAMMTNGASGDINNIPFGVVRPPRAPYEQMQIVARKAADTAWTAVEKIQNYKADVPLGMVQREITLRHRNIPDDVLLEAKRIAGLKDKKELETLPRLAQIYARRTVALSKKPETVSVTLQAIRIGEIGICAIPFETLVEIGLELKSKSPFPNTIVVGLANGRYGYLPTPRQHRLGGYETWLGTNKVQQDASEIITRELLEMLAQLSKVGSE